MHHSSQSDRMKNSDHFDIIDELFGLVLSVQLIQKEMIANWRCGDAGRILLFSVTRVPLSCVAVTKLEPPEIRSRKKYEQKRRIASIVWHYAMIIVTM